MNVIKGRIVKNISNIYIINSLGKEYEATARGKMKEMKIIPTVGDYVKFELVEENKAVINEVLERTNYLKRPKVSNVSQAIFVVSPKMPKPNLLLLDKELCYAEFTKIKPIIVINKTDLSRCEAENLFEIYTKSGFNVIKLILIQKKVLIF